METNHIWAMRMKTGLSRSGLNHFLPLIYLALLKAIFFFAEPPGCDEPCADAATVFFAILDQQIMPS